MSDAHPVCVPADPNVKLNVPDGESSPADRNMYQQIFGSLQYVARTFHLWQIWHRHFVLDLVFDQVLGELPTSILSSTIGFQHSYSLTTFSGHFGMKFLEHCQGVALVGLEIC